MLDTHTKPRFAPLPSSLTRDGRRRKAGFEIEFGGMTEEGAARTVARTLGGRVTQRDEFDFLVEGSEVGDIEVYLDTAYRDAAKTALTSAALELGREVVPVEIVTKPVEPNDLDQLDVLVRALRDDGAIGTYQGLLLGFGVHINVEVQDQSVDALYNPLCAFALLEGFIRTAYRIDLSRRLLPFTTPYPRSLVDRLAGPRPETVEALIDLYLEGSPTRNRALDMLCVFQEIDSARVDAALPEGNSVSARPAFHYRLPDCRIDEQEWSLSVEWNRWAFVERVAAHPDLLQTLRDRWRAARRDPLGGLGGWPDVVESEVRAAGVEIPA